MATSHQSLICQNCDGQKDSRVSPKESNRESAKPALRNPKSLDRRDRIGHTPRPAPPSYNN